LIFIDIDENDFKGDRSFENALSRTLKNIKEKLNGIPSVNWSGNGYHILQPIECPILEQIEEFHRYKEDKFFGDNFLPSQEFLRFAEVFLSNNKADKGHFPSFKSCQIRVPGSINGKCLDNKDRRLSENIRVKTLQKWNGSRSPVTREFIEDFRTYLEQKRTDELYNSNNYKQQKKLLTNVRNKNNNCNRYRYIEKLLQTPIEEYRKRVLWRILCPYLINVRKLSYDESFQILREWLDKCNSVRK
jgi:Primase X